MLVDDEIDDGEILVVIVDEALDEVEVDERMKIIDILEYLDNDIIEENELLSTEVVDDEVDEEVELAVLDEIEVGVEMIELDEMVEIEY